MTELNKLFYVGTGEHFQPVFDFPDTKEFIFIDSQPIYEGRRSKFDRSFYRWNFINKIKSKAETYGFELKSEKVIDGRIFWSSLNWKQKIYFGLFPCRIPPYVNPTILKFENESRNQSIKYYISTPLPLQNSLNPSRQDLHNENSFHELIYDIKTSDGMIISGHFTYSSIFNYFPKKPITFIGYSGTCYDISAYDEEDEDKIFVKLMRGMSDEERNKIFHSYLYVNDKLDNYINGLYELFDENKIEFEEIQLRENEFILSNKPKSEIITFSTIQEFSNFDTQIYKID